MKNIFIVALLCAIPLKLPAQNTFPFPSAGNVGIGTTNPVSPLHLVGPGDGKPALVISDSSNPSLELRSSGNQFPYIDFAVNSTSNAGIGSPDYNGRIIFNEIPNGFKFFANGYNSLSLPGNANVGINTTNPLSMFQVDDGCTKASIGNASGPALNYGTSYLGFNASRNGAAWLTNTDGLNNGGGVIYSTVFGDLYFSNIGSANGSTGQTLSDQDIKSRINFRIGADGTSHARQLVVELANWPDYVFNPTYNLKPLSELKAYIDQNHHLPDMPAAANVEKDGLNVGEMNKLLLKKVEELTLYLIAWIKLTNNKKVLIQANG